MASRRELFCAGKKIEEKRKRCVALMAELTGVLQLGR